MFLSKLKDLPFQVKKWWYNMVNKPLLDVRITVNLERKLEFEIRYNQVFIYELERQYKDVDVMNYAETNDDKVALMLYDTLFSIVDPMLPHQEDPIDEVDREALEAYQNIPPMAIRGGTENKQVVDIADISKVKSEDNMIGVDLRGG